jgi:hypothetical protein
MPAKAAAEQSLSAKLRQALASLAAAAQPHVSDRHIRFGDLI